MRFQSVPETMIMGFIRLLSTSPSELLPFRGEKRIHLYVEKEFSYCSTSTISKRVLFKALLSFRHYKHPIQSSVLPGEASVLDRKSFQHLCRNDLACILKDVPFQAQAQFRRAVQSKLPAYRPLLPPDPKAPLGGCFSD